MSLEFRSTRLDEQKIEDWPSHIGIISFQVAARASTMRSCELILRMSKRLRLKPLSAVQPIHRLPVSKNSGLKNGTRSIHRDYF